MVNQVDALMPASHGDVCHGDKVKRFLDSKVELKTKFAQLYLYRLETPLGILYLL